MSDKHLLELFLKITKKEDLNELRLKAVAMQLGELMHTLECTADHEKDCDFYKPEISTDTSKAREIWTAKATSLIYLAGLQDGQIAEEVIRRLPIFLKAILKSPALAELLIVLLPNLRLRVPVPEDLSSLPSYPLDSVESSAE